MRQTAALGTLLMLVACGGTPAKPLSTPPHQADTATQSATPTGSLAEAGSSGSGSGSGSGADAANTSPSPAGSSAAPTSASSSTLAEGHDACSGVAAPFEEKVRAKFNECYQAGKKSNPELAGTIKVTLKVDVKGKIKYVPEPSKLDVKVVACMVNAAKKEPFDAQSCKGKDVAVSKTFGAP